MSEATRKLRERVQRNQSYKALNNLLKHKLFLTLPFVETLRTLEGAHGKMVDEMNRLIYPKTIPPSAGQVVSSPYKEPTMVASTGDTARQALKLLGFPTAMFRTTASRTIPYPKIKYGLSLNMSS